MRRWWLVPAWTVPLLVIASFVVISLRPATTAFGVPPINFTRGTVTGAGFTTTQPGSLAFGPDGRLYVADTNGRIQALTLNPTTKAVTAIQQVSTAAQLQEVYGIAFDPTDASSPPPLYVTNTVSGFGDAGAAPAGTYLGKVTRISGASYGTRTDIISGLPVGNSGHQANGLSFGPDGKLYVTQGSMTNAGVINSNGGLFQREEAPLSAAILVADVKAGGFDGNITYSPANTYSTTVQQTGGDVDVFATGLRNPYDIVFHSNGRLYNTDNGPNSGFGEGSQTCTTNDGIQAQAADELNIIVAGKYYGHPNRNRGINTPDALQCDYKAGTEPSSGNYVAPIGLLPPSSDGLAEYTSGVFGGQMQGDLLYVSWVDNTLHRVKLSPDGSSVVYDVTLASNLFQALDVAVGADGTIYVAEYGGNAITYFKPDETPVSSITVTNISPSGGPLEGGQNVTISGTNFTEATETTVTIGGVALQNIAVQNSTTITGTTPANSGGLKDVTVSNSIGSATLTAAYNYAEGNSVEPPVANAGEDWSGPVAHNDHAHVTLDGQASVDPDGFIESWEWSEGGTVLSTQMVDSVQFELGEHLVTLTVTDNGGNVDTDQVRVIVTQFAENPELYFCFDVSGNGRVDVIDLMQVAAVTGKRWGDVGYTRLKDFNANRTIDVIDLFGTAQDATYTPVCPEVDRQIRASVVGVEAAGYQLNVQNAINAGYQQVTPYIPGQGRHMLRGGLNGNDLIFEPGNPESLLYRPDPTMPGGWRLGAMMYVIPYNLTSLPPAGFPTNEDAWHYHDWLCIYNNGNGVAEGVPQSQCLAQGGVWIDKAGWLLHLWTFEPNPKGRMVEDNENF